MVEFEQTTVGEFFRLSDEEREEVESRVKEAELRHVVDSLRKIIQLINEARNVLPTELAGRTPLLDAKTRIENIIGLLRESGVKYSDLIQSNVKSVREDFLDLEELTQKHSEYPELSRIREMRLDFYGVVESLNRRLNEDILNWRRGREAAGHSLEDWLGSVFEAVNELAQVHFNTIRTEARVPTASGILLREGKDAGGFYMDYLGVEEGVVRFRCSIGQGEPSEKLGVSIENSYPSTVAEAVDEWQESAFQEPLER